MKPFLYADRQTLEILEANPFEQHPNGRWHFSETRSISDDVAQRLIARGYAVRKGDRLVAAKRKVPA